MKNNEKSYNSKKIDQKTNIINKPKIVSKPNQKSKIKNVQKLIAILFPALKELYEYDKKSNSIS